MNRTQFIKKFGLSGILMLLFPTLMGNSKKTSNININTISTSKFNQIKLKIKKDSKGTQYISKGTQDISISSIKPPALQIVNPSTGDTVLSIETVDDSIYIVQRKPITFVMDDDVK